MAIAREATPVSSAADIKDADLDREDLLQIYRNMLVTRGIEERGHILYRQGKIPGSFYTGRGNEGAAVGVATAMRADDVGTPIQRDMGVHVTRGTEAWRIFAQYMGRRDGLAMGKDGNVHMADIRLGLIAMVSHLPALMPVAVGCALAFKIRREHRVAVGWSGDGAMARGDAHEAMNLAGVHRLPGRVHLRQQPVRLLDAEPARVRRRPPRRSRGRLRLRGGRRRRHRRAHRLPRGAPRHREGARGRRTDPARAGHAADGGPRRPRRRVLRPARAARGVRPEGPDRALPAMAEGAGVPRRRVRRGASPSR